MDSKINAQSGTWSTLGVSYKKYKDKLDIIGQK